MLQHGYNYFLSRCRNEPGVQKYTIRSVNFTRLCYLLQAELPVGASEGRGEKGSQPWYHTRKCLLTMYNPANANVLST